MCDIYEGSNINTLSHAFSAMENITLFILTWNVAEQMPPVGLDLTKLLSLSDKSHRPDLYIIGLQEVKLDIFSGHWGQAFRNALKEYNYVEMNCVRLLGIAMYVYSLEEHITKIRNMETSTTATGLMGIIGNKGAVSFRMDLYGASICLINTHLAAHDGHCTERVTSYNTILNDQTFKLNKETTSIFFHDYVFWFGDLNFRLQGNLPAKEISDYVKSDNLSPLLEDDELTKVRSTGEAFSELHEETPKFNPTFKYVIGKNMYDMNRRPAWTDRILYKANTNAYQNVTLDVRQNVYNSDDSYTVSDHKPVFAEFSIKVFSNYVDREVKFLPIDTWYLDQENSAVCHIASDVNPSIWDWIGVYEENIGGLQDYVSYIYLPYQREDDEGSNKIKEGKGKHTSTKILLRFPLTAVRTPGIYRLLYYSKSCSSLLGMSEPFNVIQKDGPTRSQLDW